MSPLNCCNPKSKIQDQEDQSTLFPRLLSLACCLLLIAGIANPIIVADDNVSPATEEELYQQCKNIYASGQFADADQCIEKFLSRYPESDHAGEMLFMRAFLRPDISASIGMYRSIIEKYPGSKWAAKSLFQLGQCYYLQGKYSEALDEYGKIIVSYPDDEVYWTARYWKCRTLIAKNDYPAALAALRSLESSDSAEVGRDMILMSLGECYIGMKDYKNAAASYRSLIDTMPDSQRVPSAYLLLAKSLQSQDKAQEAKKLYQKVIEDYRQSIAAQQAQRHLSSLTQPKPVVVKPDVPETAETAQKPPAKAETYFSIQVGAFSGKSNADRLAGSLRRKGYSVQVVRPIPGRSRLHKVRVGKFKTESGAANMARRLRKSEKLPTEVVKVTP